MKGQHAGARLARHLKELLDRFELTNGRLLGITTDNASSNYSITWELQFTLQPSGIEWPALRNDIPCMAHVTQLALGAFMRSLGVKGHSKLWEANERDQQLGENESTNIGKSQRLRKEGNASINTLSAMKPGLAKRINTVRISRYVENTETDHHIAANASCVDYVDTGLSKRVYWLSNTQRINCSPIYYGCENTVEFNSGVAWATIAIMSIHPWVAEESKILWLLVSLHNRGWMENRQVHHGSFEAILIVDSVDVEKAYSHTASWYHRI